MLGPRYDQYKSAHYQQDLIDQIKRSSTKYYHFSDSQLLNYHECIKVSGFIPEEVFFNHGWLNDAPNIPLCAFNLDNSWEHCNAKMILFLNKEYARIEEKINYLKSARFDLLVTHSLDYADQINPSIPQLFLPLAVNLSRIPLGSNNSILDRPIDLYFSGILQNPYHPSAQSDIRIQIQKELFYCLGDFPLLRRWKFRKLNIYWKPFYFSRIKQILSNLLHGKKLSIDDYYRHLSLSKAVVHTASPANIVSTRVVESLACGALGLFDTSAQLHKVFINRLEFISFTTPHDLISHLLGLNDQRLNIGLALIASNGRKKVINNYTWQKHLEQIRLFLNQH